MPIRHPPRREPRVFAVTAHRGRVAWCVADPWELRSSGVISASPRSLIPALRRLIRREKPTATVAGSPRLEVALTRAARGLGVPLMPGPVRPLADAAASALYPELPLFAPTGALRRAAGLALGAVLEAAAPTRPYATSRNRTLPRVA